MRIQLIQFGYAKGESLSDRRDRMADLITTGGGADLVVLPELWPVGGFDYTNWAESAEPIDGPFVRRFQDLARRSGSCLHLGSLIERGVLPGGESALWNTSVLIGGDGSILARYRKIHRFGFTSGEPKLLQPGTETVTVPAGPLALPIGLATCYDLRFPEQFRQLMRAGAQLFLVPAAWPAARIEHWRLLAQARALENQAFVVACNTSGWDAGVELGGHSLVVAPTGQILAEAGPAAEILEVGIEPELVGAYRESFPVLADIRL